MAIVHKVTNNVEKQGLMFTPQCVSRINKNQDEADENELAMQIKVIIGVRLQEEETGLAQTASED